jgi:phage/plasmid-like protein (TIGR03299 family)
MSHDLSTNKHNEVEMFCAGKPAWHGLGINVQDAQTWQDASKLAKLDWTISKIQLSNPRTNNPIPSFAIVRDDDDRWLSTVGLGYKEIQNNQMFDFSDAIIGTGKAHYVSAGAINEGRTVWCLARLNELDFSPVKGDTHESYLLFTDSRDGKSAQVKLTTTRVVCQNTLNIALSGAGQMLRLRHTKGIDSKINEAKQILSTVGKQVTSISDKLKALATKPVTQPQFLSVMEKLFPGYEKNGQAQNKAASVASNFMLNDHGSIKGIEGSAYALLQACTQWVDHQRNGIRTGDNTIAYKRAESAMFGSGDLFKTTALNNICTIMGIGNEIDSSPVENILSKISL